MPLQTVPCQPVSTISLSLSHPSQLDEMTHSASEDGVGHSYILRERRIENREERSQCLEKCWILMYSFAEKGSHVSRLTLTLLYSPGWL